MTNGWFGVVAPETREGFNAALEPGPTEPGRDADARGEAKPTSILMEFKVKDRHPETFPITREQ